MQLSLGTHPGNQTCTAGLILTTSTIAVTYIVIWLYLDLHYLHEHRATEINYRQHVCIIGSTVISVCQWTICIIIILTNAHPIQGYCCQSICTVFYMTCTVFDKLKVTRSDAILASFRKSNARVSQLTYL